MKKIVYWIKGEANEVDPAVWKDLTVSSPTLPIGMEFCWPLAATLLSRMQQNGAK